ncbi:hypothetical protein VF21_07606 [Pseudogymnoascus sp. 05NY08]|nr:hypothetical protein VF21_07606 [Pseudogymnoascus sp. 05NY08]
MARWTNLPAEVRMMIFGIVVKDYRFRSDGYARAGYASVCRDDVDQDRIGDFERIMGNETTKYRRDYLEHLFLRIKFDDYDCSVCQLKEDDETMRNNNEVFFTALCNLLSILSKWNRNRRQNWLTLELGAYSPGDCKHTFRDFHPQENYPYQEYNDVEPQPGASIQRIERLGRDTLDDPYHGWVNGQQEGLSLGSKQRIMGTLAIDNLPKPSIHPYTFPKVEIITNLFIRRQFYRKIAAKSLDKLLRESFTSLKWFRHETWHDVDPQQQLRFEKDYKRLLLNGIPRNLRRLSIFENYNKRLHPEHFNQFTHLEQYTRRANPSLGKALSKSSRLLISLTVSFLVDAVDFFASFQPTNNPNVNVIPWENLENLALTSRLLHPMTAYRKINEMLAAAGRAAASMPKLKIMEIWNGGRGHACVFRYTNIDGKAHISWESTWGSRFQLDPDVINSWANVPRQGKYPHGNFTRSVNPKSWRQHRMETYGSVILQLKQGSRMQHFLSFFQMMSEIPRLSKSSTHA